VIVKQNNNFAPLFTDVPGRFFLLSISADRSGVKLSLMSPGTSRKSENGDVIEETPNSYDVAAMPPGTCARIYLGADAQWRATLWVYLGFKEYEPHPTPEAALEALQCVTYPHD
jgi:hypothetical protein